MKLLDNLLQNRTTRIELGRKDLKLFFSIYFSDYIKVPSAPFHGEIFDILQDENNKMVWIVAFRGSGKSTTCSLVYVLWLALTQGKHHILIVCQNQTRSQETLSNIRRELKSNQLLFNDFGEFQEGDEPNNNGVVILGKYNVKIGAISISEGSRGTKFGSFRPDTIICDDLEDVQSAKTKEARDKLWQQINSEIIPLGEPFTKTIFIGNLIHADSSMMRFKKAIDDKTMAGVFKLFPLLDEKNICLWPGMYPTAKAIEDLKLKIGSDTDFKREYLLKILPDEDQIVRPEWISYYEDVPRENISFQIITVDPAFSENATADNSAIIEASIYGSGKDLKMCIHPFPFNGKRNQPDLIGEIKRIYNSLGRSIATRILVEKAGQQQGLIDSLVAEGLPVEGMSIQGDKATRLSTASFYIRNSQILFARRGCEELTDQIIYFGSERYDDLVDSFTLGVQYFIQKMGKGEPSILKYLKEITSQ